MVFVIKQLLIAGCETIICVSGMSSILSGILNKFGELIQKFLVAIDDTDDRQLGKISAVLFFVLALQTGLTEISAEQRFVRLYRNLCLLLTANLYIIHGMVSPILLTLSASKNRSWNRHARPLVICALLMAFPSWFFFFLWKNNALSTWLLAVSTFCVEVVIKVGASKRGSSFSPNPILSLTGQPHLADLCSLHDRCIPSDTLGTPRRLRFLH